MSSTSRKRTRSWCTKSKPSTGVMLAACPGFEECGFALGGEAGGVGRVGERERRCDRLCEWPVREAGIGRAGEVGAVQALVGLVLDPQRELHPLADLLIEQELAVDPDEPRVRLRDIAACLKKLGPGDSLVDRVELPGRALFAETDHPFGEVPGVDELNALVGRRGRRDV